MAQLTFDIYERIIDALANDIGTLKRCSLVCSAFSELSQKHIFSTIELKSSSERRTRPARRSKKFERLLDINPSIADYVRSLKYISSFQAKGGPPIPQRLHRVDTFALIFLESTGDWTRLPNYFTSSLASFIRSNSIVKLTLYNIQNLPVTTLLHFPCLTILDIQSVSVCDIPLPDSFRCPTRAPKLVEIWSQNSELEPLRKLLDCGKPKCTPILDMTDLEDITMVVEEGFISMALIVSLMRASQNLKCLSLAGSYPDLKLRGNLAANLSQASLKTLKTINMSPMLEDEETDPYLHFVEELEKIGGKNVLETLSIRIQIQTDCRCTTELSKWTQLDGTLSRWDAFPFLRSVTLEIVIWDFSGGFNEFQARLEDIGRSAFPRLWGNKNLAFEFEIKVEDV